MEIENFLNERHECINEESVECKQVLEQVYEIEKIFSNEINIELKNYLEKEINIYDYYDENFIMYYNGLDKYFSDDYMLKTVNKNSKHWLIGNGIINILKTIGWTEKGKTRLDNIYYIDDDFEYPKQRSHEIRRMLYKYKDCFNNEDDIPEYPSKSSKNLNDYSDYPLEYLPSEDNEYYEDSLDTWEYLLK